MFSAIVLKVASDAVATPCAVMADAMLLFPSLTDFFNSFIPPLNVFAVVSNGSLPTISVSELPKFAISECPTIRSNVALSLTPPRHL